MKKTLYRFGTGYMIMFLMQSCMPFGAILISKAIREHNETIIEEDAARSSFVARANFIHYLPDERLSPLYRINQTIVKEFALNGSYRFKVYDAIHLQARSFPVSQEIYIIADGEPFQVFVDGVEYETITKIDDLVEDVSTAIQNDQTFHTHSLNSYNQKINRLSYCIDNKIIEKMIVADTVKLRYYAGSNMITVRFNEYHLERLKKLINMPLAPQVAQKR